MSPSSTKEVDVKELLSGKELHWEGVALQEDDLKQIMNFLDQIVKKNPDDEKQGKRLG